MLTLLQSFFTTLDNPYRKQPDLGISQIKGLKTAEHCQPLPTYFHEPNRQLYKLHKQLDALVLQAYGFSSTDDLLEKLLDLNLELAAKKRR